MNRFLLAVVIVAGCAGCFRTTYSNLPMPDSERTPMASQVPLQPTGPWQHFFLYGWAPSEKVINAAAACGGAGRVRSIETQQSFVQGLVTSLAGFYVNIYAPWTGKVVCDTGR